MTFLDTNILLYAISTHPDEAAKMAKARSLLRGADLTFSVQVLQEFYVQATRLSRPDALSHLEAVALIQLWLRHRVIPVTVPIVLDALRLKDRHGISYWDAAILAAAASVGCTELLSEDLDPGHAYDRVRVVNPFR
jgi:predicted nucleic acid-binding protein